jgi:hypothetical protein
VVAEVVEEAHNVVVPLQLIMPEVITVLDVLN